METNSEMINRIAELAKENAALKGILDAYQMSENEANEIIVELKAENERLKHLREEINDFISDISTCGFKYDDRCPGNLDELQCCIEDLCNKFSNYKQILQEIKETIKSIEKDAINGLNNSASFSKNSEFESIQNKANECIKLITKAEEE